MEANKKSLRARKAELTKEIKAVDAYVKDLEDISQRQGDQFAYEFEGRKRERWMYLGNWFFPSTIRKEKKYLDSLIKQRKELDYE